MASGRSPHFSVFITSLSKRTSSGTASGVFPKASWNDGGSPSTRSVPENEGSSFSAADAPTSTGLLTGVMDPRFAPSFRKSTGKAQLRLPSSMESSPLPPESQAPRATESARHRNRDIQRRGRFTSGPETGMASLKA